MPSPEILFEVSIKSVHAHTFAVRCTVRNTQSEMLTFSLPAWTPGSYLIRDFSQHLIEIKAIGESPTTTLKKITKNSWTCSKTESEIVLEYEIYAFDPSIRAAFLDDSYAFFSGTSLFLRVHEFEECPHYLVIRKPNSPTFSQHQLSTSMHAVDIDAQGYGSYSAKNYDELVDHPVLIADSTIDTFEVAGVPHKVVITPRLDFDRHRLIEDCRKICLEQINFFKTPAPFSSYQFLLRVEEEGYGGLEHRSSSALLCKVADLPLTHEKKMSDNYRALLGLFSHEYFHAWNVKQLKPKSFTHFDYSAENYTDLLWFFEGVTSYYDDLFLCRSKAIEPESYLDLISRAMTRVQSAKGRFKQSLSDASFDAWIKFYRPNENSHNTTVSYYVKGSLVALALDLTIRLESKNTASLDTVMQQLWLKYGVSGTGITQTNILEEASLAAQTSLEDFFTNFVQSTIDPPYADLLMPFGIDLARHAPHRSYLGCHIKREQERCRVIAVDEESPAMLAGISAHDVLIAVNGYRIDASQFDAQLNSLAHERAIQFHFFRRGWLKEATVTLTAAPEHKCVLKKRETLTQSESGLLTSWLALSK